MHPANTPHTVIANSLTDRAIFIQGLRNAGFEIHDENILVDSPETVLVTFVSRSYAESAMLALYLDEFKGMQGGKMCLTKSSCRTAGPDGCYACAPVLTYGAVWQALGEGCDDGAVAHRRVEQEGERLAKEARRLENRKRDEDARLAKEVRKMENRDRNEEARLAKELRRVENRKRDDEAKLVKEVRRMENRKSGEEATLANEVRKMENRRRDEDARLAKQARNAAHIKKAQEAKQAKDARRARHVEMVEEARIKKAEKMAQGGGSGVGEVWRL